MKDFDDIINPYMKFFCCRLMEYSGIENSGMCFDSIYSYSKNYDNNLKEVIYELHIPDIYSEDAKDIMFFLNAAIEYLRRKMRKVLKELDDKGKKIAIYLLAAYEAEFHGRICLIKDGVEVDLSKAHSLERAVLYLVKNKVCIHEIKGICAVDKNAIQILFQECLETTKENDDKGVSLLTTKKFCDIYGCVLTIIDLMEKRIFLQMKGIKYPALQIENGSFSFEGEWDYNVEQYVDKFEADLMHYEVSFPESVKGLLDKNFYSVYGFRVESVRKIISSKPVWLKDDSLVTQSNYATIVGEFMLSSKCTQGEAEKLFSYMCFDESKKNEKIYDFPEKNENRIFEKCILKIDEDRYLYSKTLMGCAYKVLERKLMFNLLDGCRGLNERIIRKNVKGKFEEEIGKFIEQYNIKVLRNVHKLKDGEVLSNEVDVIYVLGGTLYVVECKDVSFRFTPTGFATDVMRERDFLRKVHMKIESVANNITYFEDVFSQPLESVEGYLVYRTTNYVTETIKSDQGVKIMNAEQFKERFDKMWKKVCIIRNKNR